GRDVVGGGGSGDGEVAAHNEPRGVRAVAVGIPGGDGVDGSVEAGDAIAGGPFHWPVALGEGGRAEGGGQQAREDGSFRGHESRVCARIGGLARKLSG